MSQSASASTSTSATRFESIFNSALDAYRKQTKQDLASNPLLCSLQSCDSPDAIINLLRDQIPAFSQSQTSDDQVSTWLIPTVNVLYSFSVALGEGVGLVNTSFLLWDLCSDVCFPGILTRKGYFCGHQCALFGLYFLCISSQIILTMGSFRPPKM
jgi:hypothetical protein